MSGFDQAMNVALSHAHERIYSLERPVTVVQLGIYLVRGDNVYGLELRGQSWVAN